MLSFLYISIVLLHLHLGGLLLVSASPLLVVGYIALWYLLRHRLRLGTYCLWVFLSLPMFAVLEYVVLFHFWPAPPADAHVDLSGPAIRFVPMPSIVSAVAFFPSLYALLRYVQPNQRVEPRQ